MVPHRRELEISAADRHLRDGIVQPLHRILISQRQMRRDVIVLGRAGNSSH